MARIELECDTPMDELHGFGLLTYKGKGIGYTTNCLNDDEFNFISGMNYAVNHILSNFIESLEELEEMNDSVEMLRDLKRPVCKNMLTAAKYNCDIEISRLITKFIDSHDD